MGVEMDKKVVYKMGFWSAVLVTLTVFGFALFIIISFWGLDTKLYSFISCFFIAPSFVALMVSNHYYSAVDKKVWSQLGLAFAIIYAVLVSIVYYLQITVVYNNSLQLSPEIIKFLEFTPGSTMFAIDMLGYAFMFRDPWCWFSRVFHHITPKVQIAN